jgi:hypothetical protein
LRWTTGFRPTIFSLMMGMTISRTADGLKFIGECSPGSSFMAGDILCVRCGLRIDPHIEECDVSLKCDGCHTKIKSFWSEADLHVYLAEHWGQLRKGVHAPICGDS